ncbi:MAG: FAD-binding oxidoreductase [Akkermansia sp.]
MSLEEDISRILGRGKTSADPEVLALHAGDKWYASVLPELVVFPESTEDVSLLMRYASSMNIPVTARGGGVGYVGGCVPVRGGISLSLERMNRILEIAPEDGVAVVEPGVITADLQRKARALGWFYPPDPASKGMQHRRKYRHERGRPQMPEIWVTRAYVLGLTVVLASGEVVECGGRTHKTRRGSISGTFYRFGRMLGIITRAVLRLIPTRHSAPQRRLLRNSAGRCRVQCILNSGHLPPPWNNGQFHLSSRQAYLGQRPAFRLPRPPDCGSGRQATCRAGRTGFPVRPAGRMRRQPEFCADTEAEAEAVWQLRRSFLQLKATGMTKLNEDIVPRSRLVALVEFCEALNRKQGGHRVFRPFRGRQHPYQHHGGRLCGSEKKALADACVDRLFHCAGYTEAPLPGNTSSA